MLAFPPSYVFTNIINILPLICLHCTSSTFTFIDNCNQVLKIFFNFMDKIKYQNFQELSVWDSLSESLNSWWRLTWVFWVTQCIVRLWLFVFQIVSKVCLCFEHLQKNGVSRYSNSIDAFLSFRNCFVSPRFVGLLVMEAVEEEEDGRPGQQGISQVHSS